MGQIEKFVDHVRIMMFDLLTVQVDSKRQWLQYFHKL